MGDDSMVDYGEHSETYTDTLTLAQTEALTFNKTDETNIVGKDEQRAEMFKDWAGYIGEVKNPETTADNVFLTQKNKQSGGKAALYAPLDEVLNATRPVLSKYGFGVIQVPTANNNAASVQTILTHKSGAMIVFPQFTVPISPATAQGVIAGITYARRGAINPILATHGEADDDGNAVSEQTPPKNETKPSAVKSTTKAATPTAAKAETGGLNADQHKLVDLANELAKAGVAVDTINEAIKINPRKETDSKKLKEAYDNLLKLKKESVEKVDLKEIK